MGLMWVWLIINKPLCIKQFYCFRKKWGKCSLLNNHVMMCAVRFTTRVCWCNSQRSGDVTQVGSDRVVRDTDHYAVLCPYTIICCPHTLRNNNFLQITQDRNKKAWSMSQCCSLTKFEEPVSFWYNTADAPWIDISHELPEQRTKWWFGCNKLLQTRDANTDGLLCRTFLWSIV